MPGLGGVLDLLGHFAPGAANVYAGAQRGKIEGEQAYEQAQERKRDQARQERIDAQMEAIRELQRETGEENLNRLRTPQTPQLKGSGDRTFPDTPEGRAAFDEWERTHNPSRYREPQGAQPPVIGYGARDWEEYIDRVGQVEALRNGGGDGTPRPTMSQALDLVNDDPEMQYRSADEKIAAARRLVNGESMIAPEPPTMEPVGDSTFAAPPVQAATPARAPGGRAAEFSEARVLVSGMPEGQRRSALEQAGYSSGEIDIILR